MAVTIVGVLALMTAATAAADAAPSVPLPATATYGGETITSNQAADQNLACLEAVGGKLTCFNSLTELRASTEAKKEAAAANPLGAASSKGAKARAASTLTYMLITEHSYFNDYTRGWAIAGYARQSWYDMTGGYDNSATSLDGGNHSGYLARYSGGGGDRQRVDQYGEWYNLTNAGFNDVASSRYRN